MDPVRKALWFVEHRLREPFGLEDVARACKVSPFHLTRAFAATTGTPLMRYVRGRRLTYAAHRLEAGADDILVLALEIGYGSHEAFTRAFRDHFGATPEHARGNGLPDRDKLVEALSMDHSSLPDVRVDRFETVGPLEFAGLSERFACSDPAGPAGLWQRFGCYINQIPGQVGEAAYGIVHGFDEDGATYDYLCAVETSGASELPAGFRRLSVPRLTYAVFRHEGHVAGIRGTISAIWSKWFPASGKQPAPGPMLERYGPEFDPRTGLGGFEIRIPVKE